jgi:ribosomal protein L31E
MPQCMTKILVSRGKNASAFLCTSHLERVVSCPSIVYYMQQHDMRARIDRAHRAIQLLRENASFEMKLASYRLHDQESQSVYKRSDKVNSQSHVTSSDKHWKSYRKLWYLPTSIQTR